MNNEKIAATIRYNINNGDYKVWDRGVASTLDHVLKGTVWTHQPTGRKYMIIKPTWLGDTDEYGLIHVEVDKFKNKASEKSQETVTRSISNFFGKLHDDTDRFV